MKTNSKNRFLAMLLIGALAVVVPQWAMAAGTTAGTTISNMAKASYSVGGNPQQEICSSLTGNSTGNGGTSGTTCTSGTNGALNTSFTVDRKINFTVTTVGLDGKSVTPGQTDAAFGYLITNTGNTAVTFALSATVDDTNSILVDELTPKIFLDADGDGVKDAGEGDQYANPISFGDIAVDGTLNITVVNEVSGTAANGLTAFINSITVVARDTVANGGVAIPEGGVAGTGNAIVWADSSYDNTETVATDRVWTVSAPVLKVQKSQALISDGTDGITGYIPGAKVEYTIRVTYDSGSGNATGVIISDVLPATLAAVANQYDTSTKEVTRTTYNVTGSVTDTQYLEGGLGDSTAWSTSTGGTITTACSFTLNEAGDYCEIKFRVTIQ